MNGTAKLHFAQLTTLGLIVLGSQAASASDTKKETALPRRSAPAASVSDQDRIVALVKGPDCARRTKARNIRADVKSDLARGEHRFYASKVLEGNAYAPAGSSDCMWWSGEKSRYFPRLFPADRYRYPELASCYFAATHYMEAYNRELVRQDPVGVWAQCEGKLPRLPVYRK